MYVMPNYILYCLILLYLHWCQMLRRCFPLLTRMIEDCEERDDNMADRRQLYVEMSKCSLLSLI